MKKRHKNEQKKIKMTGFSDRLRHTMEIRNLSQLRLSKLLDVTQPLIHYWLKGSDLPRKYHAQKLAWIMAVDYSWLTTGEGRPYSFHTYPIEKLWSDFPERLAFLLWTRNMNIMDLRAVMDKDTVNMWLDKQRAPTLQDFYNLADIFQCPKQWLIEGVPEPAVASSEYKKWKAFNYYLLLKRDPLGTSFGGVPIVRPYSKAIDILQPPFNSTSMETKLAARFPAATAQLKSSSESFFNRSLELFADNDLLILVYKSSNAKKSFNTYTGKIIIDSPGKLKKLNRRSAVLSYPYRSTEMAALEKVLYKGFEIVNALLTNKSLPEKQRRINLER